MMTEPTWAQVIAYGILTVCVLGTGIIALMRGHSHYNGGVTGYRYHNHHHTARRIMKNAAITGVGLLMMAARAAEDLREADD